MKKDDLIKSIEQSDMVLVGLGSEMSVASHNNDHSQLDLENAYHNLYEMIKEKNYFIVTTNMDDKIWNTEFDPMRVVAPCGGFRYLQCEHNCNEALYDASEMKRDLTSTQCDDITEQTGINPEIHKCPECGANLVFCNKNADHYNEKIYLSQWQIYTEWMQKTLNRKLCIIELGVGLKYPTVIRWPFEKMTYLNQKAVLIRIHSKLYQLTEEIKERAHAIPCDPIVFLQK